MRTSRLIAFLLLAVTFIASCQKSESEEPVNLNATGTLKSLSGTCLPANVNGIFKVATALTTDNYINVTVDITEPGDYTITTNTINGYSFSASGTTTTTGQQSIKLLGAGTPVAAGANTFTVTFGTSQCNIVVQAVPVVPVNAVYTIDCSSRVVAGFYRQGTPTTAANTVKIQATVTTAGVYTITTNVVNGVSFSGTGYVAAGTQEIILTANGGTPTAYGYRTYTVTAGSSNCNFEMFYLPSVASEDYKWSFKVGNTTYTGYTMMADLFTARQADVFGPDSSGTEFEIELNNNVPGGMVEIGNYPGAAVVAGKYTGDFYYSKALSYIVYGFVPGNGTNITADVTVYNTTTKIIEGTFSGTARQGSETTGPIVTVTEGKFKARLP